MFDSSYLLHHLLVDGQSSGGIDDDDRVAFLPGFLDGVPGDLDRVLDAVFAVDRHADPLAEHLELFDSGGSVDVAGDEHDLAVLFGLEVVSQLGGEGGLTRTLQTGHEDDCGVAFEVYLGGLAAHEGCQFVVCDLDHELSGTNGCHDVHTECFLLDLVGKLLGGLVVDIGLEEGFTDIFDRFGNIDFGDTTLTFEDLK